MDLDKTSSTDKEKEGSEDDPSSARRKSYHARPGSVSNSGRKERGRVILSGTPSPGKEIEFRRDVRRSEVAAFLLQQIRLLAEMCWGRNYDCIDVMHAQYVFPILLSIIKDETISKKRVPTSFVDPMGTDPLKSRGASVPSLSALLSMAPTTSKGAIKSPQKSPESSAVLSKHPNGDSPMARAGQMEGKIGMPDSLRYPFAKLLNALWIDVRPQKEYVIPFVTIPFGMQLVQVLIPLLAHCQVCHLADLIAIACC